MHKHGERVLVTALTRKSADAIETFLTDHGIKAKTIHADVKTSDRIEMVKALRAGDYDVLVGINLLREGLDIPQVSLVAVMEADHAGFLRSVQALIQIIGRAARNANGTAILYADRITPAMHQAIEESNDRRQQQIAYNKANSLTPITSGQVIPGSEEQMAVEPKIHDKAFCKDLDDLCRQISLKEKTMIAAVDAEEQQTARALREELRELYRHYIFV